VRYWRAVLQVISNSGASILSNSGALSHQCCNHSQHIISNSGASILIGCAPGDCVKKTELKHS